MGFRRALAIALGAALLLACGAGVALALAAGYYATALVLGLVAFWYVGHRMWMRREALPAPASVKTAPKGPSVEIQLQLARTMLDQTPAPLVTRGHDGVLRAGNRAARRLFRTDDRLVDPPPELAAALSREDGARRLTLTLDEAQGSHLYAVSIVDLIDARGPSRLAALIDIQPEIRVAEAAALRELMQVLSHEIMNALTPVASLAASAADLLSEETSDPSLQARDAVVTLARRAEGLIRFVEAYRSLSRLPAPDPAALSLCALLDEVAQLFHSRWRDRDVHLDLFKPRPDIILELDRDLMVHAVSNILTNAAEAALAADSSLARVSLRGELAQGRARIVVEDSGGGVAARDASAIFNPFFTTKPAGSGVGLSFALQVAASHGGSLILDPAAPGRGARFVMAF